MSLKEEEKKKNKDSKEKQLELINETNNNDQNLSDAVKQSSPEETDVKINNKEKGWYEMLQYKLKYCMSKLIIKSKFSTV